MRKVNIIVLLFISLFLVSCSKAEPDASYDRPSFMMPEDSNMVGEGYNEIKEFDFIDTNESCETFFKLDSNTASYSNLRRYIVMGQKIHGDIIKTDELLNYFNYDFEEPAKGETFSIKANIMDTPWNQNTSLVTIGVKTKTVELSQNISNNLVFLIDVSGSMRSNEKIGLIKQAFPLMLDGLNQSDKISIVTYASGVKVLLDGCPVSNAQTILEVINSLSAGGSTAGSDGLARAYNVCKKHFIEGGNNRIILATDGDFNVGPSSNEELKEQVKKQLTSGVYLSVLGFGMGNYQDDLVETLAMNGNGNYAYIDTLNEAKKVLTDDLAKTLISVAKDVKAKVTFNPNYIEQFRVIGYENKQLTEDEFEDEQADSSEVGSGHTTVVTYEVKFKENVQIPSNEELFDIVINYKDPNTEESKTFESSFYGEDMTSLPIEDFIFASCVVEFSLVLRNSDYKADASLSNVLRRLNSLTSIQNDPYKLEFKELVTKVINQNLAQ